jgi:hypothetical protein
MAPDDDGGRSAVAAVWRPDHAVRKRPPTLLGCAEQKGRGKRSVMRPQAIQRRALNDAAVAKWEKSWIASVGAID